MGTRRWAWSGVLFALVIVGVPSAFNAATRIRPPALPPPAYEPIVGTGDTLRIGGSYLTRRAGLWVMHVAGEPIELGYHHARLAAPLMAEGDARMLDLFSRTVPSRLARGAISTFVRARYRTLDRSFPEPRRAEIFGESIGYPDRFTFVFSTYQRLVYLHALYDIALAFERSPLLGCTAFVASGTTTGGATPRHTIVGRNFDFDADPWFDEEKMVDIVAPEGRIAFVSVAWPGMTGVVTGMNAEGMWVSVNGGRAGDLDNTGVPVVFTTRTVLEQARSVDEAIALVNRDRPMASHILLVADGKTGESVVLERAPGRRLGIVRGETANVLANHYRTTPLRDDPKDARIRDLTSTLAREARMQELLERFQGAIDPGVAQRILRDRRGVGDTPLPLGNRNALDAVVATHSVIADLTTREIWVSEGPHTLGRYIHIDLARRLALGERAAAPESIADLAEDPALRDGTWERLGIGERLRREAQAMVDAGDPRAGIDLFRRAVALRDDDHVAWRDLAALEDSVGSHDAARAAWQRVLALAPDSPALAREASAHSR